MATSREIYERGRLTAKPEHLTAIEDIPAGVEQLSLGSSSEGLVYVPEGYHKNKAAALAVMLHGAGGEATHGLSLLRKYADEHNIILLAPGSQAQSWDIVSMDSFGVDVIYLDQALAIVFARFNIDTSRIAVGGFSDGASYALSIGLSNGDLFTHLIAFSPGFVYVKEKQGSPAVFISHGTHDGVLPIDPCSRRIVQQLKRQDYQVSYHEFQGGHEIPAAIAKSAAEWFAPPQEISRIDPE